MRLLRYESPDGIRPAASVDGAAFVDIGEIVEDIDGAALSRLDRIAEAVQSGGLPEADLSGRTLAAPIATPGKIVCVGLNYRAHAAESGMEPPSEPILFMKAPTTVVGPDAAIRVPPGSTETDYEVELAVVIGRRALYLPDAAAAADVIAGYAISNDVSERQSQLRRGGQWVKGKSYPTFNPLGPWLVTPDDVDAGSLRLSLSVNAETRQESSTDDMIFDVLFLVHYISQFMELVPGDVINTGTPSGVALGGASRGGFLAPGDVVETRIEGLGEQRNEVS